jgi:hypothetical protein
MTINVNLRKVLHKKSAEMCAQNLAGNTAAGGFFVSDKSDSIPGHTCNYYVGGASIIYEYNADDDAWMQLPNSGITGTFGAGSCGEFRSISAPAGATTSTATAGSTTTLTTALTIVRNLAGCFIRVVAGAGVGYMGFVARNTLGANAVITVRTASGVAFDATTQFQVFGGSLWFWNAGAGTVGFSVYDRATNVWTARSVTGIPTTWGTDGQLVSTGGMASNAGLRVDAGTASSATATTLVDSTKTWVTNIYAGKFVAIASGPGAGSTRLILSNTGTTLTLEGAAWPRGETPTSASVYVIDGAGFVQIAATAATGTTITAGTATWVASQWINFQVRIVAGTGAGQIRAITANTGTQLTVAAWTVTPDATSILRIEGNDDHFYLAGNNAVTMYRYSISGNTWATLSPGAARAGAYATGGTLDWIDGVKNAAWNDGSYGNHFTTTLIRQNGRYLYGFRGGASATLDVYDIAANTWISNVAYGNQLPTFTTGSCSVDIDGAIYIQKEATGVIYRFEVAEHALEPFALNPYPQGAALVGDKMIVVHLGEGTTDLHYLYTLGHTRAELVRWLVIQGPGEYPRTGTVASGDFAAG